MNLKKIALLVIAGAVLPGLAWGDYERGLAEYRAGKAASALFEWSKSAEAGDVKSQFRLAQMFERGDGTPRQPKLAVKWYSLAANGGHTDAQQALARMYITGAGMERPSPEKAVHLLTIASNSGDNMAAFLLAQLYQEGIGAHKDIQQAARYYKQAANHGVAAAQNNLGNLYENGLGVKQDDRLAAKWYLRAAKTGDAFAQNNIGNLYANGKGVSLNHAWAVFWFAMSQRQGNTAATENIKKSLPHLQRYIVKQKANIRSGNSAQHSKVAQVEKGQSLPVLGSGDGWTQVYLESSQQLGWVASSLLSQ